MISAGRDHNPTLCTAEIYRKAHAGTDFSHYPGFPAPEVFVRLRSIFRSTIFLIAATCAVVGFMPAANADVQPMIVGGGNATETYSFMGSLQVPSQGYPHYCGASLISAQWMVTAAHCTYDHNGNPLSASDLQVRIGSNDRTSARTLAYVSQIARHPNYNTNYDIALLKLSSAVSNAPVSISGSSPAGGTNVRLLGWGQTCPQAGCSTGAPQYLKQLDTRVLADSSCGNQFMASNELCIYGTTTDTACYGDSGGPALVGSSGNWALVGATSRSGDTGSTCGTGNAIYTDVTAFQQWISDTTGGGATPPPGGCTVAAWQPGQWYPPGAQVSYNGHNWSNDSGYWSYGDVPGQSWTWSDYGAC